MTLKDWLVLSGVWIAAIGVVLGLIEMRLRHHLGRLDMLSGALDSVAVSLRGKVEGQDSKLLEMRKEQVRQAEQMGELRNRIERLEGFRP